MKNLKLLILISLLAGCGVLPIESQVEDDHFRLENFENVTGLYMENVYLMCFKQRPTKFIQPRQYPSGEQSLWVRASISRGGATREAIVNFQVNMEAGNSYKLNRKISDDRDKISLWIENQDTGNVASEVLTEELEHPLLVNENLRRKQCESSTI